MANITQDSDFLSKNSSGLSRERYNLPSDEEFFGSLVNYRWDDAGVSSSLKGSAPASTVIPNKEGHCHRSGENGCPFRLDPAWFEVDLSLSDLLQVIRMEHPKSCGKE